MRSLRSSGYAFGRVVFVSAMMSSVLVKSTVGEAIILHQHGVLKAHLHLLGIGDLLTSAAGTSSFGHGSRPKLARPSASQHVRPLTVIATGSVFVPTPDSTDVGEASAFSHNRCPQLSIAELRKAPDVGARSSPDATWFRRTAIANLLLRNHTILI